MVTRSLRSRNFFQTNDQYTNIQLFFTFTYTNFGRKTNLKSSQIKDMHFQITEREDEFLFLHVFPMTEQKYTCTVNVNLPARNVPFSNCTVKVVIFSFSVSLAFVQYRSLCSTVSMKYVIPSRRRAIQEGLYYRVVLKFVDIYKFGLILDIH